MSWVMVGVFVAGVVADAGVAGDAWGAVAHAASAATKAIDSVCMPER
jgi:hypothetical protein